MHDLEQHDLRPTEDRLEQIQQQLHESNQRLVAIFWVALGILIILAVVAYRSR